LNPSYSGIDLAELRMARPELFLIDLMERHYKVEIGAAGEVGDVGHAIRSVMTEGLQLFLILMRTDDHDVRTDVEIFSLRRVSVT
jgi:hypothetical protein